MRANRIQALSVQLVLGCIRHDNFIVLDSLEALNKLLLLLKLLVWHVASTLERLLLVWRLQRVVTGLLSQFLDGLHLVIHPRLRFGMRFILVVSLLL